jgi:hypothetical protein
MIFSMDRIQEKPGNAAPPLYARQLIEVLAENRKGQHSIRIEDLFLNCTLYKRLEYLVRLGFSWDIMKS